MAIDGEPRLVHDFRFTSARHDGKHDDEAILMESLPLVFVLTDDLIFGSRITAVAREVGADVKTARNVDALSSLIKSATPSCVMIDIQLAGSRIADVVAAVRSLAARARIVAYGSHVDAAGLDRATQAGCDVVLARSKFVVSLETELRNWLGLS
jgi:ActR/RegA family two-component response regulator